MNGPNWATIVSAVATTFGLLAAFVGARYAIRQYEMAVDRNLREQAAKVAFWAEVDDDELRVRYINTSGLPVWDVVLTPSGALSYEDRHEESVLSPSDDAVWIGPVWGWAAGPVSNMVEDNQRFVASVATSASQLAGLGPITGGWKRLERREQASALRLRQAKLRAEFTDAAGVRWSRSADGKLNATNVEKRQSAIDRLRIFGIWIAEGLRGGAVDHRSSKS